MILPHLWKVRNVLQRFDYTVFVLVVTLMAFGILGLYSLSVGSDELRSTLVRQVWLALGAVPLMFAFAAFNYRSITRATPFLYAGMWCVLLAVLIWGETIRGSRGWFNLGFFHVQPVEFAKIVLLITLAQFFPHRASLPVSMPVMGQSLLLTLLFAVPVMLQPDFGSAMMLIAVWLAFILVACSWRQIAAFGVVGITLFAMAWLLLFAPYQKDRILALVQPQRDTLGSSYNVNQALRAVSLGGIWGQGLGQGPVSTLRFLPEADTDFLFAVLAESFGLVGVSGLLGALVLLSFLLLRRARGVAEPSGAFFILGFAALLSMEAAVNVGMNIGLTPVVGLGFPMVSYGGSSLVAHALGFGMVQSIMVYAAHEEGVG